MMREKTGNQIALCREFLFCEMHLDQSAMRVYTSSMSYVTTTTRLGVIVLCSRRVYSWIYTCSNSVE
ncbi:hypothetical protein SK128_020520 [Halocaridina rubra]|uniref:Uncharacterized protein n=1 Tax=Halocaridina rubra TaxID=373956 RepID=A0AAN8WZD4_HALRR